MAAMAGSAGGGIISAIAGTSGQSSETSQGYINQKSMGFANFFGIDAFWNGMTNLGKQLSDTIIAKAGYDTINLSTVEKGIKDTTIKPSQNYGFWILLALVAIAIFVIILVSNKKQK